MMSETEEILVLYGSQTGNSEQAAIDISEKIPEKLGSKYTSRHMQLDDFLEIENARWTRNVIIVTSSYGVGAAPLGAYRFRALCDEFLEKQKECSGLLDGIHFALLGLGDSAYTTFFNNPTVFHEALLSAGASQVGKLGKADASGSGDNSQDKVIKRWIEDIWDPLKKVLNEQPHLSDSMKEKLKKTQETSFDMSRKLLSSDDDVKTKNRSSASSKYALAILAVSILMALFGVLIGKKFKEQ